MARQIGRPSGAPCPARSPRGARQGAQGKPDGERLRRCVRQTGTQGRAVAVALMANPSGRVSGEIATADGGEIGTANRCRLLPCPAHGELSEPVTVRRDRDGAAGGCRIDCHGKPDTGRGTVCRMWRTADGHGQRQTGTGKPDAQGRQRRQAIDNGGRVSSTVQGELKALASVRQIGRPSGKTRKNP